MAESVDSDGDVFAQRRVKRKALGDPGKQAHKRRATSGNDALSALSWSNPIDGDNTFMVLGRQCGIPGATKIAAFDFDWTVCNPKSGRFANGRHDWRWWHPLVPKKLRELNDGGFKIVFFTNQAGIEKKKIHPQPLKEKFIDLAKELGFPYQVFIAAATNHNRKPNTTMWDYLLAECNEGVSVDMSACFYVGDAAGREAKWAPTAKRDFSVSDRKFAANVGLKFLTPEEFFLGHKPTKKWKWRSINPTEALDEKKFEDVKVVDSDKPIVSDKQEMVILVGCPASGKSTFARRHFLPAGYEWVNRDTLKTPARCEKAAIAALAQGKSVIIDNTSGRPASRKQFIKVAQKAGVPVRCFWLKTPREIAEHLNFCREKQTNGKIRRIPAVAFNVFNKNFEPPTKSEGFSEVISVNFKPNFENESDRKIFMLWT
eukprot:80459_1